MDGQEECRKRLIDLSRQADRKGIVMFSDFLNLNEQDIFHRAEKSFVTRTESFGGTPYAERRMAAFLPDAFSYLAEEGGPVYPIRALKVDFAHPKFAEPLGHRDILGSLMSLGVERAKIGDIFTGENGYYIFCEEGIADYFVENLDRIRNTSVRLRAVPLPELDFKPKLVENSGVVASERLDSIVACVYGLSRSKAAELFRAGKIFVNGRMTENPSQPCREDDIVSVRGQGRFQYKEICGKTGKGRLRVKYLLYQ